jgi:hypothetical protein
MVLREDARDHVNQWLLRRMGLTDYTGGFVFVSLCYVMLRWLLQLVALRVRSDEWKGRTLQASAARWLAELLRPGCLTIGAS